MTTGYMLDTVVFNRVVEGKITATSLPTDAPLYCTYVQRQELEACREPKRTRLLEVFAEVAPQLVPTESGAWDDSPWDDCGWGDAADTHERFCQALDKLEAKSNNLRDALIGETALARGLTLITDDRNLRDVVISFGGQAILLRGSAPGHV